MGTPDTSPTNQASRDAEKLPFDVDVALQRIEEAVLPFPKAALFELAEEGYRTAFEQLTACLISIRTLDETTLPVARRLFARVRTPEAMRALPVEEIDRLIDKSSFHETKARQIHAIAGRVVTEYGGELPCDHATLLSFAGVGPKCAHLVLGIACGQARVSADIHVHRVTNRWGYISTSTPEQSIVALEAILPRRHWIEINRLLVPFGKHICRGTVPRCSTCPVLEMCRQVGVVGHG